MNSFTFYQAANLSYDEIKAQFVVRRKEFERVMDEIHRDPMTGSIQHYIFVGQRGSGKSTLLRRIESEVNQDEKLSNRLIAVNLSEEQAGIYRMHDLWDRVCQELSIRGFEIEEPDWVNYSHDLSSYSRALYLAIQRALQKKKKKLVLLIDNIDRILENIKEDTHLFRELLMNHKDVRIIGGSTRLSEHHWRYDAPFYEFFSIIRLLPLTKSEMKELLLFWSEDKNLPALRQFVERHPGRLNSVRILTDGMPRTMLHFVELLINRPDQNGYEYLRSIIDRATPIYQERLGILSAGHQKVVLELSFFWEAVKVRELAIAARMESKTVSAFLKQLVDMQIVEKLKGKDKNYLYRVQERFFNLWLIMTQGGPKQKGQVKGLTLFLETWYDETELKSIYQKYSENLEKGKISPDHAVVMTKALAHSRYLTIHQRDDLLDRTFGLAGLKREHLELLPSKARVLIENADQFYKQKKWRAALDELGRIEQEDTRINMLRGILNVHMNFYKDAEDCFKRSIQQGDVYALFLMAVLYEITGRLDKAGEFYIRAADKGNIDGLVGLANLHASAGRLEEAESSYLKAIDKGHVDALLDLAEMNYLLGVNAEQASEMIERHKIIRPNGLRSAQLEILMALRDGKMGVVERIRPVLLDAIQCHELIPFFIEHLLVYQQVNLTYNLFLDEISGPLLKEELLPYYYVTNRMNRQVDYHETRLSEPPELRETIDDMETRILKQREFYYSIKNN